MRHDVIVQVVAAIASCFICSAIFASEKFTPIITGYDFIETCSDLEKANPQRKHKCLSYINGVLAGNVGTISVQTENEEAAKRDMEVVEIHENHQIHEAVTSLATSRQLICAGHVSSMEDIAKVLVPMFYASGADLSKNNAYYVAVKALADLYPCGNENAS